MEIWDSVAAAVVTQLINLAVAAFCGVRIERPDRGEPPDDRWVEVRLTWRRGTEDGDGPDDGAVPVHRDGPDDRA
ncbi:hypothetical protein [Actinoplanes sp. DH11]|uniref:hypothetical protein n=1 Tax=Actinoplanes sp. DH11 TaxID=2857011 RepID=UPI001E5189F9|nr:hypothetical protein [Actinoplanes sp. DH11]